MYTTIRNAIAIALVLSAPVATLAKGPAQPLDGQRFTGTMKTGKNTYADTFTFARGNFDSSACHEMGFGKGPYTATADGTFEADTTSKKSGHIHWKGQVKTGQLTATAVLTKDGDAPVEYAVEGTVSK